MSNNLIYLGLGGNLPTEDYGPPRALMGVALSRLAAVGITLIDRSPWYQSAPVPASDQPWYVNGVVSVSYLGEPEALLALVLGVETELGRVRGVKNAARTVDIDILAFGDRVLHQAPRLELPHPRLSERAFVVKPLVDIAPDWRHPATGQTVVDMLAKLPAGQQIERMDDADGLYGTEWRG